MIHALAETTAALDPERTTTMNQIHALSTMLAMQASDASDGGADEPAAASGLSGPEDY